MIPVSRGSGSLEVNEGKRERLRGFHIGGPCVGDDAPRLERASAEFPSECACSCEAPVDRNQAKILLGQIDSTLGILGPAILGRLEQFPFIVAFY